MNQPQSASATPRRGGTSEAGPAGVDTDVFFGTAEQLAELAIPA